MFNDCLLIQLTRRVFTNDDGEFPTGIGKYLTATTPFNPSTGKGRRERADPKNAFCSVMQYAYQAMTLLRGVLGALGVQAQETNRVNGNF